IEPARLLGRHATCGGGGQISKRKLLRVQCEMIPVKTEAIQVSKPDFNSQELQLLLRQFERGNVVLFAGAGFSIGAKNTLGEDPPLAPDLCRALAGDCGWTYDNEELAVVFAQAQKYLGTPGLNERLFTYFRCCTPASWH